MKYVKTFENKTNELKSYKIIYFDIIPTTSPMPPWGDKDNYPVWDGEYLLLVHGKYVSPSVDKGWKPLPTERHNQYKQDKKWEMWYFDILDEVSSIKKSKVKKINIIKFKSLFDSDNEEDAKKRFEELKKEEPYKTWVVNTTTKKYKI